MSNILLNYQLNKENTRPLLTGIDVSGNENDVDIYTPIDHKIFFTETNKYTTDGTGSIPETVLDVVGYKHGTNHGPLFVEGRVGILDEALYFNGSSDYILSPKVKDTGETTVTFWFKISADENKSGNSVFTFNGFYGSFNFNHASSNSPLLYLNSSCYRYFASCLSYMDNQWHFAILYIKGVNAADILDSSLKIDLNLIVNSTTSSSVDGVAWDRLIIGAATGYFNGALQDMRIYDRALTSQEESDLYTGGIAPSYGLITHLPMDRSSCVSSSNYTNEALYFDGLSSRIHLPDALNYGHTDFSISFGVMMNYGPCFHLMGNKILDEKKGIEIFYDHDEGRLYFRHGDGTSIIDDYVELTLVQFTWYHIVCVYDATNSVKMVYVNGNQVGSNIAISTSNAQSTQDLVVGNYWNGSWQDTPSDINSIMIHDKAFSSDEISRLYSNWRMKNLVPIDYKLYAPLDSMNISGTTVYDASVNATNGTLGAGVSTAGTDHLGRTNRMCVFDSSQVNTYLLFGNEPSFWPGNNDFTIAIDIYNNAGNAAINSGCTLFSNGNQGTNRSFLYAYILQSQPTIINYQYSNSDGYYVLVFSDVISNESYHHLVFRVYRATDTVELFVDGISKGTKSIPGYVAITTGNLIVGGYNTTTHRYNGNISNFAIWHRALDDSEIASLYSNYLLGSEPVVVSGRVLDLPVTLDNTEITDTLVYALDESGNDNHGVVTGTTLVTDYMNRAYGSYEFDGTNAKYIRIPDSDTLKFDESTPVTFSFWLNLREFVPSGYIFAKYQGSGDYYGLYTLSDGKFLFLLKNTGANYFIGLNIGVYDKLNEWTHVVIRVGRTSETNAIFLDTIQKPTYINTITNQTMSYTGLFTIGALTTSNYTNALISDFKVYNRSLSLEEINQIYQESLLEEDNTVKDGLVLHLPLNLESTVTNRVLDLSGNNYHGTIVNGAKIASVNPYRTNSCIYFDGVNDYIDVPWGNDFNPYENNLTILCAVKPVSVGNQMIMGSIIGTNQMFYCGISGSKWGIGIGSVSWNGSIDATTNWQFIYLVIESGVARLYVDFAQSQIISFSSYKIASNINIARRPDGAYYSNLYMDFMEIHEGSLTVSEATRKYDEWRTKGETKG